MSLSTPVAFILFNRPDTTARVFQTIRQAQPQKLLVIADGPRCDRSGEAKNCAAARAVTEQVDWDCEVLRNYSDVNLGCRERVSSGLTWAFEHVEEAIILEDDCLPHPSFFTYCQALLERYRDDQRIMVVTGNNFQDGQQRTDYSYYFSKYNHCWGWATWKRAWQHWHFDPDLWLQFRDAGLIRSVCEDPDEAEYWTKIFDNLFLQGKPDSWAYAWTFACWSQGGLTASPNLNLVSNIGFGEESTHTGDPNSPYANMQTSDLGEISHPPFIVKHEDADRYTFDYHFGGVDLRKSRQLSHKVRRKLSTLDRGVRLFLTQPSLALRKSKSKIFQKASTAISLYSTK